MAGVLKVWNPTLGAYEPVAIAVPRFDIESGAGGDGTSAAITTATWTEVALPTADWDTDSFQDTNIIEIPEAGIYDIAASLRWAYSGGTGEGILLWNVEARTNETTPLCMSSVPFKSGAWARLSTSISVEFAAGDRIHLVVYQSTTVSQTPQDIRWSVTRQGGAQGTDGLIGSNGSDGADGADGATGATGPAGADGTGVAYPIDSLFTTTAVYADSAAVATALGFGTWTAFGAGKVLVGLDSGDTDFDAVEETGGSKTQATHLHSGPSHTHTEDLLPSHTHGVTHTHVERVRNATSGGSTSVERRSGWSTGSIAAAILTNAPNNLNSGAANAGSSSTSANGTGPTGSAGDESIVQPYIVVYFWKRTA